MVGLSLRVTGNVCSGPLCVFAVFQITFPVRVTRIFYKYFIHILASVLDWLLFLLARLEFSERVFTECDKNCVTQ